MLLRFDFVGSSNFFAEMKKLTNSMTEFCDLPVLRERDSFVRRF